MRISLFRPFFALHFRTSGNFFVLPLLTLIFFSAALTVNAQLPITISYNWRPPFPVPESIDNTIPYWGFARIEPSGRYYIRYNLINIQQARLTQEMLVYTRVHEHGHIVLQSSDEGAVDCWSSKQLARTDPKILDAAINWLDTVMGNQGGGYGGPMGIREPLG